MKTCQTAEHLVVLCDCCGAPVTGDYLIFGECTGTFRCRGDHCARVAAALLAQKVKRQTGRFRKALRR